MGLHVTPHGTFYVQRSLRTGEVVQVLPVKRPDMPSQLPSVDSLGITENFIESRRASLAADTARASNSQGRLQQELATAGGESLLATGKAALAQKPDSRAGGASNYVRNTQNSSLSQNYDGEIKMACDLSTARPAGAQAASAVLTQHTHPSGSRQSQNDTDQGSSMNYVLSKDPHQVSSAMIMAPHMLPVRSWPDAHNKPVVNLPPFRAVNSTATLTYEEELRHKQQNHSRKVPGVRRQSSTSFRSTSLIRSSSRNSSRSISTSNMDHVHTSTMNDEICSISNMVGSEGSVSSTYSENEASTPTVFSPGPEFYYCNSNSAQSPPTAHTAELPFTGPFDHNYGMVPGGAILPDMPLQASYRSSGDQKTPRASILNKSCIPLSPNVQLTSMSPTSFALIPPTPLSLTSAQRNKNKTVWIIRTLEPRKMTSGRTVGGEIDTDEPQRVQTFMETHTVPW